MRREGDLLVAHVAQAQSRVLLCAPFIKAGVLRHLLGAIRPGIAVDVVTRWDPHEVGSGVSDLEVFDLLASRPGATLRLLDTLHAKIYLADDLALAGSANLTAKALGWCAQANVEILVPTDIADPSIAACLAALGTSRLATSSERDLIAAEASAIAISRLPEAEEVVPALAAIWFPKLGDPRRLYPVYAGLHLDRMMSSTIEAARHDLSALGIAEGLTEAEFHGTAGHAFAAMPAIGRLLALVESDLPDDEAMALVAETPMSDGMPPDQQWLVIREWMAHFLSDRIEVAPQSFVTRRRPGGAR